MKEVEKCLLDNKKDWYIKKIVENSRIPIIKFVHRATSIDCDLSFTDGLPVEKSNLIKTICDKNPTCRKLILFIKKWINYCDLIGTNGISSFAVAWLVIYYLQIQSILPSIADLIDNKTKSHLISGWETGVSTDIFSFTSAKDFKELLKNFFKFYAEFDYQHDIICPLLGKIVKKIAFIEPNNLPAVMKRYVQQVNQPNGKFLDVDYLMCLQDPFDLAQNITRKVDKLNVYRFKIFCSSSFQKFE